MLADRALGRATAGAAARWRPLLLAVAYGSTTVLVLPGNLDGVHDWQARYMTCRAGARGELARWLFERTPPDATFPVSDAGLLPARAGERTASDAFSFNDPVLQRTGPLQADGRASLAHAGRPEVIVLASRDAERLDHTYRTDAAVAQHPAMSAYRPADVGSGAESCRYQPLAYRP